MKPAKAVVVRSDLGGHIDRLERVHLPQLPPFTTLLVRTRNSLYRIVVTEGSDVYVQGGSFFPESTSAHIDGASLGGCFLMVGWIRVGFRVEIQAGGQSVITSPVRSISSELPNIAVAH